VEIKGVDTMAFSWSETVTTGATEIKASHWQELQDNTDYLNDNPGCGTNNSSVDAAADATVDASADATINAIADSSADSGKDSTVDVNDHGTYNSSENSTINSTNNETALASHNTSLA